MQAPWSLVAHLSILGGLGPTDGWTGELTALGRQVFAAVPSCLALTVVVARHGIPLPLTVALGVGVGPRPGRVLASLAVPLTPGGGLLVLRAAQEGAFLVLADDLDAALGEGHPRLVLDGHLDPPPATERNRAAALAAVRDIDRAIGVLLEAGIPPEEGEAELRRRARLAEVSLVDVARQVLSGISDPAGERGAS